MNRSAFSLVELSIVLVILGLLVGGILAGRSLIRASELRKHIAFHQEFSAGWSAFRDKYLGLPGDMTNATEFWGKSAAQCNSQPGTAQATGTCNGNGDGKITWSTENPYTAQQMSLAGFGQYAAGYLPTYYISNGSNNLTGMWSLVGSGNSYADLYGGNAPNGTTLTGNGLATSRYNASSAGGSNQPISAALNPEDTWNLDTKMDDGTPVGGGFRAANGLVYGQTGANYENCLTSSGGTYIYSLDNSAIACRYILRLP